MKKTLMTLAVLGAASGAAVAQSSVTLYGVADIGLGEAKSAGESKVGAESNSIVTNSSSRIGLTGKEDLGGGLWAGFKYESQINLANGATPANAWSREANVQVGSNSFGQVKLGRSLTPSYDGVGVWELTGLANYSVVYNTYGGGGYPNKRSNAQLEYKTPNIAGLSAEIAYVPKADGALLDNGVANQTDRWDLNVAYQQGPISAAFTANKASHSSNLEYGDKANYSLGGRYKLGNLFALAASYNRANSAQNWRDGGNGKAIFGKRYGFTLGGSVFLDAFTVTLDLTRDTKNEIYNHKYTNGLLEAKYSLSKRTFLYADYLRLDGNNNYSVGLTHKF